MERTYTTAPEDYDGFGTYTVKVVAKDKRDRDIRMVETPAAHVNWQRNRYFSGCHGAWTEADYAEQVEYGLVEVVS